MLGMIFLLIGTLSPGAADAWDNFATTVYTAPDLPEFSDPFLDQELITTQLTPDGNSTVGYSSPPFVYGCPEDAYYMCLWNYSQNDSYIQVTPGDNLFSVSMDMKALRPPRQIVMVFVDVACYASTNVSWVAFIVEEDDVINYFLQGECTSNSWRVTRERWEGQTDIDTVGYSTDFDESTGMEVIFAVNNETARVTYLRVFLLMSSETTCPTFGDWWSIGDNLQVVGCMIGKMIDTGVKMFLWIGSAIIFVAQFIIALGAYLAAVIGSLAMGFGTSIAYLFALPGAPPIVQGIIVAIFLGILMFMGIVVARIISSAIPG